MSLGHLIPISRAVTSLRAYHHRHRRGQSSWKLRGGQGRPQEQGGVKFPCRPETPTPSPDEPRQHSGFLPPAPCLPDILGGPNLSQIVGRQVTLTKCRTGPASRCCGRPAIISAATKRSWSGRSRYPPPGTPLHLIAAGPRPAQSASRLPSGLNPGDCPALRGKMGLRLLQRQQQVLLHLIELARPRCRFLFR